MTRTHRTPSNLRSNGATFIGLIVGIGMLISMPGMAHAEQTVPNPPGRLISRRRYARI